MSDMMEQKIKESEKEMKKKKRGATYGWVAASADAQL